MLPIYRIISIFVGFIYLSIEVRKFIYNIKNYNGLDIIFNIINIIFFSFLIDFFFQEKARNNVLFIFLSLILSLKVLSILKFFSRYYVILVRVGKNVFLFLVIF